MTTDPVLRFRPEFPILEKTNSASVVVDEIRSSSAWERWRGRPVLFT
jgi:hypothetical protein